MLSLGRRRAGRILSKMFILCGFPCSVKGKRRVRDAAALRLTGSACQIVKRALQLIRDGGQVMSVRKKALDREGCFYYALALGIDLGRLSAKG